MHGTYLGGNIVRLNATVEHDGKTLTQAKITVTMTQLRELMDELEAAYKEQSCCPSCGTLTYGEGTCADCRRYEESKQALHDRVKCYHGVSLSEFCYQCDDDSHL